MKKYLFFLFLMIPFLGYGQSKSSIDLVGGIEYAYRTLSGDEISGVPVGAILNTRKGEVGKIGYRFGFNYNQRLSQKIFLKTGIRIANLGYKSEHKTDLRWGSEIQAGLAAGTGPIFDPSLPHEVQFTHDYWFLEIPLIARYEFKEKRFSPFVEMGISPNVFLDARTKQVTDIGTDKYSDANISDDFNKIQVVGSISFGVNFSATESFQIFAQPVFRYHLTKTVDASIKEHLYNVGLEMGCRKRLK